MDKKGFTLIELLAVIVILAIIALIATPIVLKIIGSSKTQSISRSAENYIDSVNNALANTQLNGMEIKDGIYYVMDNGDLCSNNEKTSCTGVLIKVKIRGMIPTGTVTIEKGKIASNLSNDITKKTMLVLDNKTFTYNNNKLTITTICHAVTNETKTTGTVPSGNYNLGDEYICNVDNTNSYHFFILSVENDNVNLILDRNIASDGTLTNESNKGFVAWVSKLDYNDDINWGYGNNNKGPITAMNFAYNATKSWANIPNINIDYIDEGNYYGRIKTTGNNTTITMKDNLTVTATYTNLKVRLPKYNEITAVGCTNNRGSCPLWIYNYLNSSNVTGIGLQNISGIYGYWLISSSTILFAFSNYVDSKGYVNPGVGVTEALQFGVRPVITIPKSQL